MYNISKIIGRKNRQNETVLSDVAYEDSFDQMLRDLTGFTEPVVLDLSDCTWVDLWAIIQVLFLMESRAKSSPFLVRLRDDTKRGFSNRNSSLLVFLYRMKFFHVAHELQVQFCVKDTRGREREVDFASVLNAFPDFQSIDAGFPVIPISPVKSEDDVARILEPGLEDAAGEMSRIVDPRLVEESGIDDAVVREIAQNIVHHSGGSGYIALRVCSGIRSGESIDARRKVRQMHPLLPWREHFKSHLIDPYFEFVACDVGLGIFDTFKHCANSEDDKAVVHKALQPYASSISAQRRIELGLPTFTGFGAVTQVLERFGGSIIVRERDRTYFNKPNQSTKRYTYFVLPRSRRSNAGNRRKLPLSFIRGCSVSAVIPCLHRAPGVPKLRVHPQGRCATDTAKISVRLFRIPCEFDAQPSAPTALDQIAPDSSGVMAGHVKPSESTESPVLTCWDFHGVDHLRKPSVWPKLDGIVTGSRPSPLIFTGLTVRCAEQLKDWFQLEYQETSHCSKDWILVGFGDTRTLYVFGFLGGTAICSNQSWMNQIHQMKFSDQGLARLWSARYPAWAGSSGEICQLVYDRLADAYGKMLINLPEFAECSIDKGPVELPNGTVLSKYFCVHSLCQKTHILLNVSRLVGIRLGDQEFDVLMAVGATSAACVQAVFGGRNSVVGAFPADRPDIRAIEFLDIQSFLVKLTDANSKESRPPKVLLLVDGIHSGAEVRKASKALRDHGYAHEGTIALFQFGLNHGLDARFIFPQPVAVRCAAGVEPAKLDPFRRTVHPEAGVQLWEYAETSETAFRAIEHNELALPFHTKYRGHHKCVGIDLDRMLGGHGAFCSGLRADIEDFGRATFRKPEFILVIPERSTVRNHVRSLERHLISRGLQPILCIARECSYPSGQMNYEFDEISLRQMANANNFLILEGESFTGSSIRALLRLVLDSTDESAFKGVSIGIYIVVDSLAYGARRDLAAFMRAFRRTARQRIHARSYFRLPITRFFSESTCPVCQAVRERSLAEASEDSVLSIGARRLGKYNLEFGRRRQSIQIPAIGCALSDERTIGLYLDFLYNSGDLEQFCDLYQVAAFESGALFIHGLQLASRDLFLLDRLGKSVVISSITATVLSRGPHSSEVLGIAIETLASWPPIYLMPGVFDGLLALLQRLFADGEGRHGPLVVVYYPLARLINRLRKDGTAASRQLIAKFDECVANSVTSSQRPSGTTCIGRVELLGMYRMMLLKWGTDTPSIYYSASASFARLAFVLSYFVCSNRPEHWPLRSRLDDLRNASDLPNVDAIDETRHFLGSLKMAIRQCRHHWLPEDLPKISTSWDEVERRVSALDASLQDQDRNAQVPLDSCRVWEVFYQEDLLKDLCSAFCKHRINVEDLVGRIVGEGESLTSDVCTIRSDADSLDSVFVVIPPQFNEVCRLMQSNFEKSKQHAMKEAGELFALDDCHIGIDIEVEPSLVHVRLSNSPVYPKQSSGGSGLGQIAEHLRGYVRYQFDSEGDLFTQEIAFWRILA